MRDILTPSKGIPVGINHLRVWDKGDRPWNYAYIFLHVFQTVELLIFVTGVTLQGHKFLGGRSSSNIYLLKRQRNRHVAVQQLVKWQSRWKPQPCGSWSRIHSVSSQDSSAIQGSPWDSCPHLSSCGLSCHVWWWGNAVLHKSATSQLNTMALPPLPQIIT